jgi:hypothetical protein
MAGVYTLDSKPLKTSGILQRFNAKTNKRTPEEEDESQELPRVQAPEQEAAVEQIATAEPAEQERARALVQGATDNPAQIDVIKEQIVNKPKRSHGETIALGLLNSLPALLAGAFGGSEAGASTAAMGIEFGKEQRLRDAEQEKADRAEQSALSRMGQEQAFREKELAAKLGDSKADRDLKLKLAQMEMAGKQAAVSQGGKLTEGEKAVDKDYAKDLNDWVGNGKATLSKNLQALKEARSALETDSSLSGGLTGILPERLTSNKVLQQRQKVGSAIQESLRATLGSAFTEKEGERILKNAYNEAASPEANKASLDALIKRLEDTAATNDDRAAYFKANRSLAGFQAKAPAAAATEATVIVSNGSETLAISPDDLADAEKDGFKRIK